MRVYIYMNSDSASILNMEFANSRMLKSEEDTAAFADEVISKFISNINEGKREGGVDAGQAIILALSGDLGSGKTTFTKKIAAALGVAEVVTSPTFVIQKKYQTKDGWQLIHMDAYRLENEADLDVLGFKDLVKNPKNIIVIEWPERIMKALPKGVVWLRFQFVDETTRKVQWV